jgi:hypothetical protein
VALRPKVGVWVRDDAEHGYQEISNCSDVVVKTPLDIG